ncbi:M91 family zinc metallopeptidase, partial [Streptomyces sp. NPDC088354]|uniref:M91 family zinc metallopeptidase n=1 Tax=Streptomyces sp. NPDC088354 TaxID=3365856 RepID=UPI0038190A7B
MVRQYRTGEEQLDRLRRSAEGLFTRIAEGVVPQAVTAGDRLALRALRALHDKTMRERGVARSGQPAVGSLDQFGDLVEHFSGDDGSDILSRVVDAAVDGALDLPLDRHEFAGLEASLRRWQPNTSTWSSEEGEMFPGLVAHALGIRLRTFTGTTLIAQAGPQHATGSVDVHYNGHTHYDAVTTPALIRAGHLVGGAPRPETKPSVKVDNLGEGDLSSLTNDVSANDRHARSAATSTETPHTPQFEQGDGGLIGEQSRELSLESELPRYVNAYLKEKLGRDTVSDEHAVEVYRELEISRGAAFARRDLKARFEEVALEIAGIDWPRMRGGKSGLESEFTFPLAFNEEIDSFDTLGDVLAWGPNGARIVGESKQLWVDSDENYYRNERDAIAAVGDDYDDVDLVIPELIVGEMNNVPHEQGGDFLRMLRTYMETEAAFESIAGDRGGKPTVPLKDVLKKENGWRLTELAKGALIGPRPIGDNPGAHVHHNIGVPLAVVHPFLAHVRDNTWRDQRYGYHTRDHLTDALVFSDMIASRYMNWRASRGRIAGNLANAALQLNAPDRGVQELRGHAALVYVHAAAAVNGVKAHQLDKASAAVLARHDPAVLLSHLPEDVQRFLQSDANSFVALFEKKILERIDFYRLYRENKSLRKNPPAHAVDFKLKEQGTVRDFLLSSVQRDYPQQQKMNDVFKMTILGDLDTNGGSTLPLVVLEVRSYGKRHSTAMETIAQHGELSATVQRLYPLAVQLTGTPTMAGSAAIPQPNEFGQYAFFAGQGREQRAERQQGGTHAGPSVMRHHSYGRETTRTDAGTGQPSAEPGREEYGLSVPTSSRRVRRSGQFEQGDGESSLSLPAEPRRVLREEATAFPGIFVRWDPNVDPTFLKTVNEQLLLLAGQPVGRALLESIGSSRTRSGLSNWQQAKVKIERVGAGTVIGDGPRFAAHTGNATRPINAQWASDTQRGTLSLLQYNPNAWETADGLRPPFIGLAHELIHVQRNLHGLSVENTAEDEAQVVGLENFAGLEFTENKIRAEHGLSPRQAYTEGSNADNVSTPGPVIPGPANPVRAGSEHARGPEFVDLPFAQGVRTELSAEARAALEETAARLVQAGVGNWRRGLPLPKSLAIGYGNGRFRRGGHRAEETGTVRAQTVADALSARIEALLRDVQGPKPTVQDFEIEYTSMGRQPGAPSDHMRRVTLEVDYGRPADEGRSALEADADVDLLQAVNLALPATEHGTATLETSSPTSSDDILATNDTADADTAHEPGHGNSAFAARHAERLTTPQSLTGDGQDDEVMSLTVTARDLIGIALPPNSPVSSAWALNPDVAFTLKELRLGRATLHELLTRIENQLPPALEQVEAVPVFPEARSTVADGGATRITEVPVGRRALPADTAAGTHLQNLQSRRAAEIEVTDHTAGFTPHQPDAHGAMNARGDQDADYPLATQSNDTTPNGRNLDSSAIAAGTTPANNGTEVPRASLQTDDGDKDHAVAHEGESTGTGGVTGHVDDGVVPGQDDMTDTASVSADEVRRSQIRRGKRPEVVLPETVAGPVAGPVG